MFRYHSVDSCRDSLDQRELILVGGNCQLVFGVLPCPPHISPMLLDTWMLVALVGITRLTCAERSERVPSLLQKNTLCNAALLLAEDQTSVKAKGLLTKPMHRQKSSGTWKLTVCIRGLVALGSQ